MEAILETSFFEFAIILIFAAVLGGIGQMLRQPLIVMFILLGILLGPSVLDLIKSEEEINLLAEMGIAVLLFVVGLKLDLKLIKSTGKIALLTGLGQVFFTSFFGFFIGQLLGYSVIASTYIAIALTFSSTIIIVKLLSDKKEIDALHGQIALGFLIVQDIVVVLLMIVLSAMGKTGEGHVAWDVVLVVLKGLGLLGGIGLLMKFVLPYLVMKLAKSTELLLLFAISWAIGLAAFSDYIGFSSEVGAFLGGISLASTPFRENLSNRLVSIRDFLLLFFFIHLGSGLDLSLLGDQVLPATLFSVFVLVGNPLIVMIIMGYMGYRRRTSFLAGLTVAQISEFSLIFAALGMSLGHIDEQITGLITMVGLITIGISTYLILYSHQIFEKISPVLKIFERKKPYRENNLKDIEKESFDVILFGLGRYGSQILQHLKSEGYKVLGIDFDPEISKQKNDKGSTMIYGDIEDPEILESIPTDGVKFMISSINDQYSSACLAKCAQKKGFKGKLIATAYRRAEVEPLKERGFDMVLVPFTDSALSVHDKLQDLEKANS
ncbi:MAG: sodium:proton exchanger [Chitinophagaceae bacterium]|nr:MAG: sodium:proton exchanger [Chitinophagaceae bacterium]